MTSIRSNSFVHDDLGHTVSVEPKSYQGNAALRRITGTLDAYAENAFGGLEAKISGEWYLVKKDTAVEVWENK